MICTKYIIHGGEDGRDLQWSPTCPTLKMVLLIPIAQKTGWAPQSQCASVEKRKISGTY